MLSKSKECCVAVAHQRLEDVQRHIAGPLRERRHVEYPRDVPKQCDPAVVVLNVLGVGVLADAEDHVAEVLVRELLEAVLGDEELVDELGEGTSRVLPMGTKGR